MNRGIALGFAVAAMVVFTATATLARPGRGWNDCSDNNWRGGRRAAPGYQRQRDPVALENVSGVVTSVDKTASRRGRNSGVHLTLKTDSGNVAVLLGPDWFVEKSSTKLAAGDAVEVTGSRVTSWDRPAIVATQVRKGNDILVLRDDKGIPNWAGWRR